ncbi:hypothetical protein L596_002981 [Steinernema carpocapsae]|uniref:Uncharacterized protein n=1 Tax=Steinernema carpocapsae TaxID=34508 RepID=A0A4U8UUY9_STECR|nr:hypothetical protein L596_002981 [Steinernema carpocapsae]
MNFKVTWSIPRLSGLLDAAAQVDNGLHANLEICRMLPVKPSDCNPGSVVSLWWLRSTHQNMILHEVEIPDLINKDEPQTRYL